MKMCVRRSTICTSCTTRQRALFELPANTASVVPSSKRATVRRRLPRGSNKATRSSRRLQLSSSLQPLSSFARIAAIRLTRSSSFYKTARNTIILRLHVRTAKGPIEEAILLRLHGALYDGNRAWARAAHLSQVQRARVVL